MIDMNLMAKRITLKEGKKLSLSIAQVKEVLKITLGILAKMSYKDVADLLKRVK